jgi:hypothetical protein
MPVTHDLEIPSKKFLAILLEEMQDTCNKVASTLYGPPVAGETFMALEHETAKMALMGRAARAAQSICAGHGEPDSTVAEIRAAGVELEKWKITPELSSAFQVFNAFRPAHPRTHGHVRLVGGARNT